MARLNYHAIRTLLERNTILCPCVRLYVHRASMGYVKELRRILWWASDTYMREAL